VDERRAIDRASGISVELQARLRRINVTAAVLAVLWAVASVSVTFWLSGKIIRDDVADAMKAANRDTAEAADLVERIFHELTSIPYVITGNVDVHAAIVQYDTAGSSLSGLTLEQRRTWLQHDPHVAAAGNRLAQIRRSLNYAAVYAVSSSGTIITSANWNDNDSLVGIDVSDRRYFREAMAGRSGFMFAYARTANPQPVLFFSAPMVESGSAIGATVITQFSEAVESLLPRSQQVILIVDDAGMVVVSSHPQFRLRYLGALTESKRPDTDVLRNIYGLSALKTIDAERPSRPSHEAEWTIDRIPNLVTGASLQESGYSLLLFTPIEYVTNLKWLHYVIGALVALIGALFILAFGRRFASLARQRHDARTMVRLNEKLTAANVEMTAANAEKNRYLGIAAHDLRNPLSSIRGLSQLLMEHAVEPPQQDEFHQTINRTSDEMLGLVNDLLDVSVIESGRLDLRRTAVDTGKLVRQRVELLEPYARSKKIEIALDASGAPPANIDAARFGQVIDNLISNAIKFSPLETRVTVTLHPGDGSFVFSVQDQGPGIAEAERKLLFQSFQKLSARPTGGEKSTGLGLAIVKKIVDAHGGSIAVDSTPGSGTKFTVTVPSNPQEVK
jgi:signal transduction histidine kinase